MGCFDWSFFGGGEIGDDSGDFPVDLVRSAKRLVVFLPLTVTGFALVCVIDRDSFAFYLDPPLARGF